MSDRVAYARALTRIVPTSHSEALSGVAVRRRAAQLGVTAGPVKAPITGGVRPELDRAAAQPMQVTLDVPGHRTWSPPV